MHRTFQTLGSLLYPLVMLISGFAMGCGGTPPDEPPVVSSETTTEQAKLRPNDGVVGSLFGVAVALSGNTALLGAYNESNVLGDYMGAAYVFERNGDTWTQQTKLLPSNPAGAGFGYAVALDGDVALVEGGGGVYVFERSGTTWNQQQKLEIGSISLALSGDRALVGNPDNSAQGNGAGAASVYVRINGVWTLEQELFAEDGAPLRSFGRSVALTSDTALVGAMSLADPPGAPGAAYVFTRQGQTWTQQAKLSVDDIVPSDMFGEEVALSGNTALISAAYKDDQGKDIGAAYVFVRNGGAWVLEQKLTPSTPWAGNFYLGRSIALEADTVLLSANDDHVHKFQRSGGKWTEGKPLAQSKANYEPSSTNLFGDAISLSKNTALVGAPTPQGFGSAYVFVLP